MSWLTELAGRTEHLLNKLDSEVASAFSQEGKEDSTYSAHHHPTTERCGLQSSASVPSNLSRCGGVGQPPPLPIKPLSSPPALSSPRPRPSLGSTTPGVGGGTRKKEARGTNDDLLIDFLNSPLTQDPEHLTVPPPESVSSMSLSMVSSGSISLGHSRHSSVSSASSSLVALSGRNTPADHAESGSCGSGSGGSVNTDCYVTVDTPTDVNISAPSSTDGSTSSGGGGGGGGMGSTESEVALLRREVTSLNQEMTQVLRRAKEAEKVAGHLRQQVSVMSNQQSATEKVVSQMQEKEREFQGSLSAKDSQLAGMRLKVQKAVAAMEAKDAALTAVQMENSRLVAGVTKSSSLHTQALQTLEKGLVLSQQEVQDAHAQHFALTTRVSQMEKEAEEVGMALAEASKKLEEEKTRSLHLSTQVGSLRGEVAAAREELTEYKEKAGRILQSKEKLIASLKESREEASGVGIGGEDSELLQAELQQVRSERDLLREELEAAMGGLQRVTAEMAEVETTAKQEADQAARDMAALKDSVAQERARRDECEMEVRQLQEEVRSGREDLTRQKVTMATRLTDREAVIDKLRQQVAHKQSSSGSVQEVEQRLRRLTESLIQKQATIETLSTEKHSLIMQLERLQQQYEESQKLLDRDPPPILRHYEVRNRVPSFLVESPFDRGVTLGMKRAYSTLDKFSVWVGVFLRRNPSARVFVILYMCLLHLWVMLVLLTYTPEVHGPQYHSGSATLPHLQ